MSSLENQQWFVLRSNGQDGPFDPYEFSDRIESGDIESSALVWREGLDKWVPCSERNSVDHAARYAAVAAIEATLRENSVAALLENGARAIASRDSTGAPLDFGAAKSIATLISANAKDETLSEIAWLDVSQGLADATVMTSKAPARKYFGKRNVSAVVAAALVVIAISSFLGRKTLPEFADGLVIPQEKKMLLLARSADVSGAPRAAIARALQGNYFYVASNARTKDGANDGARLTVRIDGVPRSMLGRIHFSIETAITLQDGIAVTPELKAVKGKYRVSVLNPETGAVLTTSTYFLGGSADAAYYKELEDFMHNVDAQAETERLETQQFVATLRKLLSETTESYAKFRPKMEKENWNRFHTSWTGLFAQIRSAAKTWKSDSNVLRDRYLGLAALSEKVSSLHDRQSAIIRTGTETDNDRNELAALLTSAETELRKLTGPES